MRHEQLEQGYHYQVMRRALDLIDAAEGTIPLDDLAAQMGMSPAHFQRLFSAWVGVSPKRYQQYLALGHAKALLAERFTTLETAHNAGLTGTGRLHDLFIRWEAMSPGDFARGSVRCVCAPRSAHLTFLCVSLVCSLRARLAVTATRARSTAAAAPRSPSCALAAGW